MKQNFIIKTTLGIAAFLTMTNANAADGWQNLKWGMTSAEVAALYPVSEPLCKMATDECDSVNTQQLSNGLVTTAYNVQFKTMLVIKKGTLQRVVMTPINEPSAEKIYGFIEKDYGAPTKTSGAIREWRQGQTIIMFVSPEGKTPGLLYANIDEMLKR